MAASTMVDTIHAAIERVFAPNAVWDVQLLHGSVENRTWQVACAGERLIAKLPESVGGATAGAALEYDILGIAAEIGLAPTPRGFDAQSNILFADELAECRDLTTTDLTNPEIIDQLARMLRRLHAVAAPTSLRSFDVPTFVAEYLSNTDCVSATRIGKELLALHERYAALLSGDALCHNDLHCANILLGEQLWLVDFEYAVRANPIVDIASFAALNGIASCAAFEFARQCAGGAPAYTAQQLDDIILMQTLLAELWELARSSNNACSQRQSK